MLSTQTSTSVLPAPPFASRSSSARYFGIVSGEGHGHVDNVLMRPVDALLAFLALYVASRGSALCSARNLQNTIIVVGIAFTSFLALHRARRGAAGRADARVEAARAWYQRPDDDHPASSPTSCRDIASFTL